MIECKDNFIWVEDNCPVETHTILLNSDLFDIYEKGRVLIPNKQFHRVAKICKLLNKKSTILNFVTNSIISKYVSIVGIKS